METETSLYMTIRKLMAGSGHSEWCLPFGKVRHLEDLLGGGIKYPSVRLSNMYSTLTGYRMIP